MESCGSEGRAEGCAGGGGMLDVHVPGSYEKVRHRVIIIAADQKTLRRPLSWASRSEGTKLSDEVKLKSQHLLL